MTGRATLHVSAYTPVTISCVGDSITHGVSNNLPVDLTGALGGYRSKLADLLDAGSYTYAYVGGISDGPANATLHDGWDGYGMGGTGQAPLDCVGKATITLTATPASYCLFMAGTNDMLNAAFSTAANRATMATRLATILDTLHGVSPGTVFIIATIPPIDPVQYIPFPIDGLTPNDTERTNYNSALPGIAAARSSWCYAVDPASDMNLVDHLAGGVHPNGAGYQVIADHYAAQLETLLTSAPDPGSASSILRGIASLGPMQGFAGMSRAHGRAVAS